MKSNIYPCLWLDHDVKEIADFYSEIFENVKYLDSASMVTTVEIEGVKFMFLNGGPAFKVNPSVSYYVYCQDPDQVQQLFDRLNKGGKVLMSLDEYAWSKCYAWVEDRFGVNWQLDSSNAESKQRIVPTLLFANQKKELIREAINHYSAIFPTSKTIFEAPYAPESGIAEGTLLFAQFELNGYPFNATSSTIPHDFDFSEGNSFVVECKSQEEIDFYWSRLTEGGEESRCGWLKDRFGVWWQVIPENMSSLLNNPVTGTAAVQEMMKMKKIDIRTLELAGTSDKY